MKREGQFRLKDRHSQVKLAFRAAMKLMRRQVEVLQPLADVVLSVWKSSGAWG